MSGTTAHPNLRKEVSRILQKRKRGESADHISQTHGPFREKYPKFFDKLMEDNVDTQQMQYIIGMYEKVQRQKTTFDDASKQIGQRMFDQYVKPDLPPPSDTASPGIQFSSGEAPPT